MHDPDLHMGRRFGYIQCIATNLNKYRQSLTRRCAVLGLALNESHVMCGRYLARFSADESTGIHTFASSRRRLGSLRSGMPTDGVVFVLSHVHRIPAPRPPSGLRQPQVPGSYIFART